MRLFLRPKAAFSALKTSYSNFMSDKGTRMSASLAYYTTFSLAPLLVIAIAIAGLVFGAKAAQNAIAGQVQGFVGPNAAKMIEQMVQSAHKPAHGVISTIIGIGALLLGASGVFGEIQDALNTMWHANTQAKFGIWNLIKSRLLSYGMVLIIGFLLLVSLMVSAFLAGAFKYFGGIIPVPEVVLQLAELIVSLFIVAALFALMFKVLPDVKLTWKDVSVGAVSTAVLFTIGKFVIGLYLGKFFSSSTYGAAGSLVLVISWIYYSAVILYFGAEFTRVYATKFGSLIGEQAATRKEHREQHRDSVPPRPTTPNQPDYQIS
jgi:membrane protein